MTDRISTEIVRRVSIRENVEPGNLPPLDDAVDADALESLFGPKADGRPRSGAGTVQFRYAGYRVCVTSDGAVELEPASGRD